MKNSLKITICNYLFINHVRTNLGLTIFADRRSHSYLSGKCHRIRVGQGGGQVGGLVDGRAERLF